MNEVQEYFLLSIQRQLTMMLRAKKEIHNNFKESFDAFLETVPEMREHFESDPTSHPVAFVVFFLQEDIKAIEAWLHSIDSVQSWTDELLEKGNLTLEHFMAATDLHDKKYYEQQYGDQE